jgi:hypothetical protein
MARRRSAAVHLTITAMLAASLSACSSEPDPNNVAICVDPQTQQRVDDSQCGGDYDHHIYGGSGIGSGFFWYFVGRHSVFPPIGGYYGGSGGSFLRPSSIGGTYRGSARGGTVARGGFGGSARGGS